MQIKGIKNGAVLQRGADGECKIYITADAKELSSSIGKLTKLSDGEWVMTGIKTGGPYAIVISSEKEQTEFTEVYVGDVWLLGGQSNMEGAGDITEEDKFFARNKNKSIRAFYMEDEWREAEPLLHRLWNSKDDFIREEWKRNCRNSIWKTDEMQGYEKFVGVGPGFSFARKIYGITGVPQGVIPCGIGGSSLAGWNPDSNGAENYYTAMIRRLGECGGNVRGMYWDQGEAECSVIGAENYIRAMKRLVEKVREDTGNEKLPVVINQIGRNTLPFITDKTWSRCWTEIREKQRRLPEIIPYCDCVSTANAELCDLIHKASRSQHEIGRAAATAMCNLCGTGGAPSIKFKGVKITRNPIKPFWYCVDVYYENVIGGLTSYGYPYGFSVGRADDSDLLFNPYMGIRKVLLMDGFVRIELEKSYEEILDLNIWYCLGNNAVCTITDGDNRYLPAMGPVSIKENVIK